MRKRHALAAGVTSVFVLLAASIPTASAVVGPTGSATVWSPTGTTTGCPGAMHLLVPNKSPAYFAEHPEGLFSAGRAHASAAFTQARQRAAAAHIRYLTSITCRSHPSSPLPQKLASSTSTTANWAGYETPAKGNFLGAQMSWTVPSVSTSASTSAYSSIWPGVGTGASGKDSLIQGGTEQDVHCVLTVCSHTYYPWLEIFPYESQQEITNLTVAPNQVIQTIIEYDPGDAAYAEIDNLTTGVGVYDYAYLNGSFTGSGSTAEWIVERTEEGGKLPYLANFGKVSIAAAIAAEGVDWSAGHVTYPDVVSTKSTAYTMTTCAGTTLATPSAASNSSFTVTWKNKGVSQAPCT
jgi:Peptidase A4 family